MTDSDDLRELLRRSGAKGGKKAAEGMTKRQRSQRATRAAKMRWAKKALPAAEAQK